MGVETPLEFVEKWRKVNLKESASAQSHFNDLCELLDHPKPLDVDPEGTWFTFEYGVNKTTGTQGFADVFKKGFFGWEYKGKRKDLQAAYSQLQQYAPALANPPLLIVCDTDRFVIHTNWNDLVSETHEIALEELLNSDKLNLLRYAFHDPDKLKPAKSRQQLTIEAASDFATIADKLRQRGHDPHDIAHFVNRLIFCMFAEDIDLLPKNLFTNLLERGIRTPDDLERKLASLFSAMRDGKEWGMEDILWFNGGLFDDDKALKLELDEIKMVYKTAQKDWSDIDPSIMGTLFERCLDPGKLNWGVHYTDRSMIMKIIDPVIVEPLISEWDEIKDKINQELAKADEFDDIIGKDLTKKELISLAGRSTKARNKAQKLYNKFKVKLKEFKVLDPACGSGNFLYLSLQSIKDIEDLVNLEGEKKFGLSREMPEVGPENIYGIEINPYAAELARVSVWIGEIQWVKKHGFTVPANPVLREIENIVCHDALMNEDGSEYHWPKVDTIVGNPPFIGDKKMNRELGEGYTSSVRELYKGRVFGGADFVCFWFYKAYEYLKDNRLKRVGLVSTNSIRSGRSREVLKKICDSYCIYNAWSDKEWVNEGASVRVSMVCFSKEPMPSHLNGSKVQKIYPNLEGKIDNSSIDFTRAKKLKENKKTCFVGVIFNGEFEVSGEFARECLLDPVNVNGKPNTDVIRPTLNGDNFNGSRPEKWVVDFGVEMDKAEASFYEKPFRYVLENVKPYRQRKNDDGEFEVKDSSCREKWWRHARPRPAMRKAMQGLDHYIATPMVSSYRTFSFLDSSVLPDQKLVTYARDDFGFLGILHSKMHYLWTLRMCSWIGAGNDITYSNQAVFETFPFPSGMEPNVELSEFEDNLKAQKIIVAAKRLNELRESWLNPAGSIKRIPEVVDGYPDRIVPVDKASEGILKKRTLANLYSDMPTWLRETHKELDDAVAGAYGWLTDLGDDEILEKLFVLNQERAKKELI